MAKEYFQSDEFNDLLKYYERQKSTNRNSIYLDDDEFADIADHYLSNDFPRKAMEAVDMGLEMHQGSEILLLMKSAIFIYQFRFKEADAILAKLDKSDPEVIYQMAQLQYAYYMNIPKAEKMWRKWLRLESEMEDSDEEYRKENYIHILSTLVVLRNPKDMADKERELTRNTIRRWVKEYITTFQPLGKSDNDIQLVDICRENDMPDLLCEALTQVLEEQPYLPKGWSTLALAHYVQMENQQALEACDFALAINPDDLEAILTKAYILYELGNKQGADETFMEFFDKGGSESQMLPYAEMLFQNEERKEAMALLTKLSQSLEKKKKALEKNTKEAANKSDKEKAEQEYETFMQLYNKSLSNIGEVYYRNNCLGRSLSTYAHLIEVGDKSSDTYFMLGLNYLAAKMFEDATRNLWLALQHAEDKVMTGIDIAMTYIVHNYDELALKVLEYIETLVEEEDSMSANNIAATKALSYLKLGNIKQFLELFKDACNKSPELVQHVYGSYFPEDLPISEWYDYAQREMPTLIKKMSK